MLRYSALLLLSRILFNHALKFEYLDPAKLQTKISAKVQQNTASHIISRYLNSGQVTVEVNPLLFTRDSKDVFELRTSQGRLHIRASTGVAALWGFNYYLKKYCKSHIGWQVQRVVIPDRLPEVDESIVANDRFRYYQNVCTASYSFVWWDVNQWKQHVEWMALNGINLALAPVAQEAAWAKIYSQIGMTDDEINLHFTGPAFLTWLRMGNIHGWGGPLPKSWHERQRYIQREIVDYMFKLGMVPIFPAFNGHVPKAFSRIYPNTTFHSVDTWNRFSGDHCCGLFLDPSDPMFKIIGKNFLNEVSTLSKSSHIYTADPFNEVKIQPWYTELVEETANSIYSTLSEMDEKAVWLLQNWMFVNEPLRWPKSRVKSFLTSVPKGRMLILDLQSEQWPQYDIYKMYFGQPFLWCMLHNFGGTLGMFGNMQTINKEVYDVRSRLNSTMIGIGLTPEGINQNYVVYELMLESGWRKGPVKDLESWLANYAERRYGCNSTSNAWSYLLKSVYSFNGLNRIRGKYVFTRRPSFRIKPWAWYKSHDLFEAFRQFAFVSNTDCNTSGFNHDLVDITRQALQYRAEQIYRSILRDRFSNNYVFNASINQFLDVMSDMEQILATNVDFTISNWLFSARYLGENSEEKYLYEMNARNQITLWGPNGEITDYASKQWAELFRYYYIPRWTIFLSAALDTKSRHETFDEKGTQNIIRSTVENQFQFVQIHSSLKGDSQPLALSLYKKWAYIPGLDDLPQTIIKSDPDRRTTLADIVSEEDIDAIDQSTDFLWHSTTPTSQL